MKPNVKSTLVLHDITVHKVYSISYLYFFDCKVTNSLDFHNLKPDINLEVYRLKKIKYMIFNYIPNFFNKKVNIPGLAIFGNILHKLFDSSHIEFDLKRSNILK